MKNVKKQSKKFISEILIDTKVKIDINSFIDKMIKEIGAKNLIRSICVHLSFEGSLTAFSPLSNMLKNEKQLKEDVENVEVWAMLMYLIKNWDKLKNEAYKTLNIIYDEASRKENKV